MNRASDIWFHRVKSATRDLVKMAGGVVRAGEVAGVSKSEVSRWQSATDSDVISLPAILALEAECGMPMVTTAMAELNGRRLTDANVNDVAVSLLGAFTGYTLESAELQTAMSQALADGKVTPAEAETISRAISDTVTTLSRLKMVMAGIKVTGPATLHAVGDLMAEVTSIDFITNVLAYPEHRESVVERLSLLARAHRSRASDYYMDLPQKNYHLDASRDYEALAELYKHAEHPYVDIEEGWWDAFKWHPPLRVSDGPFSSPAGLCLGD